MSLFYFGSRFKEIFNSLSVLSDEVDSLKSELSKSQTELVFCHNDLLCGNLIYNDIMGMSLIWEGNNEVTLEVLKRGYVSISFATIQPLQSLIRGALHHASSCPVCIVIRN